MNKNYLLAWGLALVLGVAVLFPAGRADAQDLKPLVTVSFAGYEALMSDVGFFANLAGQAGAAQMMDMQLKAMTGGQGLAGLDPKRRIGVMLLPDATSPVGIRPLIFVPVTDMNQLLGILAVLQIKNEQMADGVTKIQAPQGKPVFAKQQGKWTYLAMAAEHLVGLPDDPLASLNKQAKNYDLAVSANVANVPERSKQSLMGLLEFGVSMGLQREPGESEEQYALRQKMTQGSMAQIKRMMNELDTVFLGLSINPTGAGAGSVRMDAQITAKPGTTLAERIADVKRAPSKFAGFAFPGAAMTANAVGKIAPEDIAQTKTVLQVYEDQIVRLLESENLPEEDMAKAKRLLDGLFGVLKDTIEAGKTDVGGAVLLSPNAATLVAGMEIADGAKLDKVLRDLAKTAMSESPQDADKIQLDAATVGDVKLHTVSIPLPPLKPGDGPHDQELRAAVVKLIGENIDVVVGTGPKAAYVAAGRDAKDKLTEAINRSKEKAGEEILPSRFVLNLTPVVETLDAVIDEPDADVVLATVKEQLAQAGSDTHVTITATPVTGGVQQRLEFEKGAVQAVGTLIGEAIRAFQEAAARAREMHGMPPGF